MRWVMLGIFVLMISTQSAAARPAHCPVRAWCGCWLAQHFGYTGAEARKLWLARAWLAFPRASLAPGNVAVFSRGRGGHVGKIIAVNEKMTGRKNKKKIIKTITMISGNDGRQVRTRERPLHRLIAVVRPS